MTGPHKAVPVAAPASAEIALPGATYRDAFALVLPEPMDAKEAIRRTLGTSPGWVSALMAMRKAIVAPFGLKHGLHPEHKQRIGFFPIISEAQDRVVLGLDDHHLDFRIVADVEQLPDGTSRLTATTLVRTHNRLGRVYLAAVMPFHRAIVPAMLNQAA